MAKTAAANREHAKVKAGAIPLSELTKASAHQIWLAGLGAQAAAKKEPGLLQRLTKEGRRLERAVARVRHMALAVHQDPSAVETAQLRRNADARRSFLAEFGTLTSREVAKLAGSRARNREALANRWKAEGRIFAVESGGQILFPVFQFSGDDGQPRPVIAKILAALLPRYSGWQTALWFAGRNGWLGARRPVDILETDPDAAALAARRESEAFD